jgi:hypothetical protein
MKDKILATWADMPVNIRIAMSIVLFFVITLLILIPFGVTLLILFFTLGVTSIIKVLRWFDSRGVK